VLQPAEEGGEEEDDEGSRPSPLTGPAAEEVVEQFRGFLEDLDPSDFMEGGGGRSEPPGEPGDRPDSPEDPPGA
jgi:hypothetical protein